MSGHFLVDQRATAAVVGTILLVAITVAGTLIVLLIGRDAAPDEVDASVPSFWLERDAEGPTRDLVVVAGRIDDVEEAFVTVVADGAGATHPLGNFSAAFADPTVWRAGESICIVGAAPGCAVATADELTVVVTLKETVIFDG